MTKNNGQVKVILIAVLNWGLGHATRSVPVIKALISHGYTPVLASDGIALRYLQQQFPNVEVHTLPEYKVHYKGSSFLKSMLLQLPRIAKAAHQEHKEIKRLAKHYKAVGIISDNRLGAYHKKLPSMYITHQVNIKAGVFSAFAGWAHQQYINRFDLCVIPDFKNETESLAGTLSHGFNLNIPSAYCGPLSRFSANSSHKSVAPTKYIACIVLSGPEPARTFWETEILQQVASLPTSEFLLIRGSEKKTKDEMLQNLTVINLANETEVLQGIANAKVVVSRSGYSSLMDYVFLRNKALFVPTPGQSEQEYLAERLKHKFAVQNQTNFNLEKGLKQALEKEGFVNQVNLEGTNWQELFSFFECK